MGIVTCAGGMDRLNPLPVYSKLPDLDSDLDLDDQTRDQTRDRERTDQENMSDVLNSEHGTRPERARRDMLPTVTYTTTEVMRMLGVSYRKLDHWSRRGYIPGQECPGSGHTRTWTDAQIDRVRLLMMASEIKNAPLDQLALRIGSHLDCALVA